MEVGLKRNSFQKVSCSPKLLVPFNNTLPLIIACDASPYAIRALLSHRYQESSKRLITSMSRSLSSAEKNYSEIEKGSLSLVDSMKKLHQYIRGLSFIILTDPKPFLRIMSKNKYVLIMAASRFQSWAIIMSGYDYNLTFKSRKENIKI